MQNNQDVNQNNVGKPIKVSTIAKTRKIYSRHGSEYVENAFKESINQKQPWQLRKNQHDLKANLTTTYHAPSDRAFWTFESFKESGEFVAPSNDGNGTLALVFLRGGDGKKHREYHWTSERHIKSWKDGRWVEYRDHMSHFGFNIHAVVNHDNNRDAWLQEFYAKDIQNGEPSSFGEYKSVLGGLSNNGIYARRIHGRNISYSRGWVGFRTHRREGHEYSEVHQLADIYTSEPTRGEEGFVIVKLKPNQVVPVTVGSGGEVIVNYINCIKDYKGNIVESNKASVNNIIAHIPKTEANVNKSTRFKIGNNKNTQSQDVNIQDANANDTTQNADTITTQNNDANSQENTQDVNIQDANANDTTQNADVTQSQDVNIQDADTQDVDYDTYIQNQLQQDIQNPITTIEKNAIDIRRYVNYKKQLWIDTAVNTGAKKTAYSKDIDIILDKEFNKKLEEYERLNEEILMRKKIFHGNMAITTQEDYSDVSNIDNSISLLEEELAKAAGYTKEAHRNLRLKDALIATELQEYEQLQTAYLTILAAHSQENFIAAITPDIGEKYANANISNEIKIQEAVQAKKKDWIYRHRYGLVKPQAIQNHNNTLKQHTQPNNRNT